MTRESSEPYKASLVGSYHRDVAGLERQYRELVRNQCQVLSPRSLRFIDPQAAFVRNMVETGDESTVERHHLEAIALSDFIWVHAPEGYVGKSGSFEIGYATALGIPIFGRDRLQDPTLNSFFTEVPSVFDALERLAENIHT